MSIGIKKLTQNELESLGVFSWGIWEKEESEFDWHYDKKETCYFLDGEVDVELEDGRIIHVGQGDLVTFPEGLSCRWNIKKAVKKHYCFE